MTSFLLSCISNFFWKRSTLKAMILLPFRTSCFLLEQIPFQNLAKLILIEMPPTPPLPLPLLYLFPLTPAMLNKLRCNCWPTRLSDPGCWYKFTYWIPNSLDPDQLASSEANLFGSTLFAKTDHIWLQQDQGYYFHSCSQYRYLYYKQCRSRQDGS